MLDIKIKFFCSVKAHVRRMRDYAIGWKKIFANHISKKEFSTTQLENRQKIGTNISPRKIQE
jgi:hypothetical protein